MHGGGENQGTGELARGLEMMIAKRVASYRFEMEEVMPDYESELIAI